MPTGMYDRKNIRTIPFPNKFLSEIDLSYAAGIIDGEGSIMVIHHKPRKESGHRWEYWVLRISISNNNKILLDWLLEVFGGGYSMGISKNPKWNDTYLWRVDSKIAKNILELVFPYLKLKKRQAELALKMIETHKLTGCKGHTQETIDLRRKIAEEIKSLNAKGKKEALP